MATEKHRIVIISCGKLKNNLPFCQAKDAYVGRAFRLKRKYAELTTNPWFILSAKYGLLNPDDVIDPNYDTTLTTRRDIIKMASWIKEKIPEFPEFATADEILFLGPKSYCNALKLAFVDNQKIIILHPTEGMNQGKSQQAIKKLITAEKNP